MLQAKYVNQMYVRYTRKRLGMHFLPKRIPSVLITINYYTYVYSCILQV